MDDIKVLIVGAGLSGLCAAKWLTENGIKVIVLEASNRVGGRTFTKRNSQVGYVDVGASYIGPTQNRIFQLAEEFGIEHYEVDEEGDQIHYKNGVRTRFRNTNVPRRRNPIENIDINNVMLTIDKQSEEIPINAPWDAPCADQWDTTTFEEFLKKTCWTKSAHEYFRNYININLASEAYETSLLGFLWYVKQCGGTQRINSTKDGAQERKFIGGSQQLSEKVAEKLGDAVVLKNSLVIEINQENKDFILVKTMDIKYEAKYVILACPPFTQMKIHFKPPLPPLRNQLLQRTPMGSVIKAILFYKTAFWKEKGICGTVCMEGDDEYPVFQTMDDTKPDGSYPALVGFITGDKACRIVNMSSDERKCLFAKSLAHAMDCKEALNPVHYEEMNWMSDEFCGGGYTTTYPPGLISRYGKAKQEPIGRIHFAGTETANRWSGYMEGAIAAGERSAREVLYSMGHINQEKIWAEGST